MNLSNYVLKTPENCSMISDVVRWSQSQFNLNCANSNLHPKSRIWASLIYMVAHKLKKFYWTASYVLEPEYNITWLSGVKKNDKILQISYWTWLSVTLNNFLFFLLSTLDFVIEFILKQWCTSQKSKRPLI